MTASTRALPSAVRNNVGLTPAVSEGPALLAGIAEGPGLRSHRDRLGPAPTPPAEALVEMARDVDLRGRGGAGFPFAIKLAAAARRKAVVVVNAAEGEPASHKDAALSVTCALLPTSSSNAAPPSVKLELSRLRPEITGAWLTGGPPSVATKRRRTVWPANATVVTPPLSVVILAPPG